MFDYIRLTGELLLFLAAVVAVVSVPLKETGDGSGDPLFYEILLLIESFSLPLRCFFT